MTRNSTPKLGDNSAAADLIERYSESICQNLEEIGDLRENIKAAKAEAKANGLDLSALLAVVKHKQLGSDEARRAATEAEEIRRLYFRASKFEVAD